ncbi:MULTISPECIES: hypothetical protein [unclassified Amycolatopsis]|uniref:hypothetical protein n=1 Tax=unclassified Amycolatopsis TaxID=2618356 RepID=UPI002876A47E|nr:MULTISPECIES: hypothetical protein [unclassified Amycolatopsis]MDS0138977.1 hypothetical protein [Amycolatopsis sp. 505]MDS0147649.1 hypothetical protein [Amycolatopsis sp. CM201R]
MSTTRVDARRRSIQFDGRTITLRIDTKTMGIVPDWAHHKFPVAETNIRHRAATTWKRGQIVFEKPGAPTDVVTNVPLFADKLPGNVFEYAYPKLAKVKEFLEAVEKARKK